MLTGELINLLMVFNFNH